MKIIDYKRIDNERHDRVTFIRVDPESLAITLKHIFQVLSDLSWISKFDDEYVRTVFQTRAQPTIDRLETDLLSSKDDEVTAEAAEYVISELSREALINQLNYLDIPLAELLGRKVKGNPGFDYYSRSDEKVILFGEAKFLSAQNAYGSGLKQVNKFINLKKDVSDLFLLEKFCTKHELDAVTKGVKGFIVGFSAKETATDKLIEGIIANDDYKKLLGFQEIIFVAVNL